MLDYLMSFSYDYGSVIFNLGLIIATNIGNISLRLKAHFYMLIVYMSIVAPLYFTFAHYNMLVGSQY